MPPPPLSFPTLQKQGHKNVPTVWPTFHDRRNLPPQTSACLPAQQRVSRTGRRMPSSSHTVGGKLLLSCAEDYTRGSLLSSAALPDETTRHWHVHTKRYMQTLTKTKVSLVTNMPHTSLSYYGFKWTHSHSACCSFVGLVGLILRHTH